MQAAMVAINETPATVACGREACVKLTRLAELVRRNDATTKTLLPNFLAGVLKTKFAILWPAAIEAFVSDAETHFEDVWPMLLSEMKELQGRTGDAGFMLRRTLNSAAAAKEKEGDKEDLAEQADGMEVDTEDATDASIGAEFDAWRSNEARITDFVSYHSSVWTVLEQLTPTFRKNREIVPLFLEFIEQYKTQWSDHEEKDDDDDDDDADTAPAENMAGVSKRLMNAALCDYLRLFGTFKDAGNFKDADQVRCSFENLLTKAEPDIQRLALDCLVPFRKKQLALYMPVLREMIDEKTFRDAITVRATTSVVPPASVAVAEWVFNRRSSGSRKTRRVATSLWPGTRATRSHCCR